ncbi:MAG: Dyp-type peroxidase [Gemmatimonadota bacterium]
MEYALEKERMQGLIVRGYGGLPSAQFLVLGFGAASRGRAWLADLADRLTAATERPERRALHAAFTHGGLKQLGLPAEALASFSPEFQEGMSTGHRSRILGDHGESDPAHWTWGGGSREVHAILMLYAVDDEELAAFLSHEAGNLAGHDITVVAELDTFACPDFREHFGFRDGIAQPIIDGLPRSGPADNTVAPGEFVLGYPNQYERLPGSPTVAAATDRAGVLPPDPDDGNGAAAWRDFGRNGTYMVFRQLSQDVRGFWSFVDRMSRNANGEQQLDECVALASKMVGRWPNGAPLVLAPEREEPAHAGEDAFAYHATDPHGLRCPVGAHIRRANPRDSLAPDPGDSTVVSNRHRLLRRGRTYGRPVAMSMEAKDVLEAESYEGERGLHFVCLNTDIARQFEFVQHTWINNPKFEGMYNDVDAVSGDHDKKNAGYFTIPAEPVRRRVHDVPRFVHVRGGAYFFMPSIDAVRYLAALT